MEILVKVLILALLAFVTFSLFRALYFLVRPNGDKAAVVRALGFRVGFSALVLIVLAIARGTGVMEGHSVQETMARKVHEARESASAAGKESHEVNEKNNSSGSINASERPRDPGARRRIE